MTAPVPKNSVGGNKTGSHQNISESQGCLEGIESGEVYVGKLGIDYILHGMGMPFVCDTASEMDSSVNFSRIDSVNDS